MTIASNVARFQSSKDKLAISNKKTTLTEQLTYLQQKQFTGRLDVQSRTGKQWKLYFCLSRLVWASGGEHPNRSWLLHLAKYCPQVDKSKIAMVGAGQFECQNYHTLTVLLKREMITREQLTFLVKSKIAEILFDIVQEETTEQLNYSSQVLAADFLLASGLKMSLAIVDVQQALLATQQAWSVWCQKGLGGCKPSLAPSLRQHERLKQQVPKTIYQNLVKLIDGKSTLRDLAFQMNKDVLQLTISLVPFIKKGFLQLREIPDLPLSITTVNSPTAPSPSKKLSAALSPLVACIDDSPQIGKIMEQILKGTGCRFVGIQDPLEAVPTLIQSEPELIFLDIGMPIINGYEICAQIRRVSKLKDIPVIILTGNDAIVDRMRAKVVGANDFLSKPIEVEKITNVVSKFCRSSQII